MPTFPADTTKKKKKCNPGKSFPCGYSCQAQGRKCRNLLKGQSATYQEWLQVQSAKIAPSTPTKTKKTKTVPPPEETKVAKPRRSKAAPPEETKVAKPVEETTPTKTKTRRSKVASEKASTITPPEETKTAKPGKELEGLTPIAKEVVEFSRKGEPMTAEDKRAIASYAERNTVDEVKVKKILDDAKEKGVELDREDAIALHYALTGYAFAEVNRPMWDASVKDSDLEYGTVDEYRAINKGINRALDRLPATTQVELNERYRQDLENKTISTRELTRYCKLEGDALNKFLGQYKEGSSVTTGQIFPTTAFTDPENPGIERFSEGANVVFKIKTPPDYRQSAARHVDHYKHQAVEGEMLYPAGSEFKVSKVTQKDGKHIIEMEEVPRQALRDDVIKKRMEDFNKAVESGDMTALTKAAIALDEELSHTALAKGESDNFLKGIFRVRGFDGKPTLKSEDEIEADVANGDYRMTRSFKPDLSNSDQGRSHWDQFVKGDYYTGNGIYGNGTYCGYAEGSDPLNKEKAFAIAQSYAVGSDYNLHMTFPKSAKIGTYEEILKVQGKIDAEISRHRQGDDAIGLDAYYSAEGGKLSGVRADTFGGRDNHGDKMILKDHYGDIVAKKSKKTLPNGNTEFAVDYEVAPKSDSSLKKTFDKLPNKGRLTITRQWEESPEVTDSNGFKTKTITVEQNKGIYGEQSKSIKITKDPKSGLTWTEDPDSFFGEGSYITTRDGKHYSVDSGRPFEYYVENPSAIKKLDPVENDAFERETGLNSITPIADQSLFVSNAKKLLLDQKVMKLAQGAYESAKTSGVQSLINLASDPGRLAALLGYDAYIGDPNRQYMVVLNRSKVSVSDRPLSQEDLTPYDGKEPR